LFIEAKESGNPIPKPKKIFLQAKPEERDRLRRRAGEIFPDLEIASEPGDQYFLSSHPGAPELSALEQKFSEPARNLSPEIRDQAYLLNAENDRISIFAGGAPGLYYGLLSLAELFQKNGGALEYFDHPIFSRRGFLQDLSRGQVLTPAGFERLAEALSAFRYNWLTFNLEHNFGYERHPEIPGSDDQLLKSEAKALFELCKEHYVEVVPMQQSFGHLRGILSRQKYRHLAFDEKLLWSLDPRKDEIYSLLAELYQEQAECFPGKYFLVGLDEPFDLKKYWKPELAGGQEFPEIYLEHLRKLNRMITGLGRRLMVWGDIFVAHPELLPEVPEDVVIINWQYGTSNQEDENFYLGRSKAIAESGREFYPATATWSYARLFPELKTMESNNRNFLKVGARLGAKGALLTNWGDLGHLQLLGGIALPIAFFAVNSWRPREISLPEFGKDFALNFFNDRSGKSAELYLLLDRLNQVVSPGKFFGGSALFVLLDELFSLQYLPARSGSEPSLSDQLVKIVKETEILTSGLGNLKNSEWLLDLKPMIYALGILFSKILIQENASLIFQQPSKREEVLILFGHLSNYFQQFALALRDRWLVQAKPRGLERNLARLVKVVEGYQKRLNFLKEGKAQTWEQFRDAEEFSEYRFNLIKEMGLEGLL